MVFEDYHIVESDLGPMVSHSRVSVYDVMMSYDKGHGLLALCTIYELTPMQVHIALDYITKHRQQLEQDLKVILPKKAELERYYRALASEREKAIAQKPMTPKRAAFYALREKNCRLQEERLNGTSYS